MRLSTEIYTSKKKLFMNRSKISEEQFSRLIRMKHSDALDELDKLGMHRYNDSAFFSFLWFYKRSVHAISKMELSPVGLNSVDLTGIEKFNYGLDIDTVSGWAKLYIHVGRLKKPFKHNGLTMEYHLTVYNNKGESQTFYFDGTRSISHVYFLNAGYQCEYCRKCSAVAHPIREDKKMYLICLAQCCQWLIGKWCSPISIFKLVERVIAGYVNQETIEGIEFSNGHDVIINDIRRPQSASTGEFDDTERVIPKCSMQYLYKESVKRKSLGGTHKSPVSHSRSGYYRKSNRGSFILVGDQFVPVPRGTGDFTWVAPPVVNPRKDTSIADMI